MNQTSAKWNRSAVQIVTGLGCWNGLTTPTSLDARDAIVGHSICLRSFLHTGKRAGCSSYTDTLKDRKEPIMRTGACGSAASGVSCSSGCFHKTASFEHLTPDLLTQFSLIRGTLQSTAHLWVDVFPRSRSISSGFPLGRVPRTRTRAACTPCGAPNHCRLNEALSRTSSEKFLS